MLMLLSALLLPCRHGFPCKAEERPPPHRPTALLLADHVHVSLKCMCLDSSTGPLAGLLFLMSNLLTQVSRVGNGWRLSAFSDLIVISAPLVGVKNKNCL